MNVAIIGCGLIGRKRALALRESDRLVACCDSILESSKKLADEFNCKYYVDHKKLISETVFDAAIVAVINKSAKEIIIDCLSRGIHVLAEKPLGRNAEESAEILDTLQISQSPSPKVAQSPTPQISPSHSLQLSNSLILKTGFNHRFHPVIWKAKQMLDQGDIGNCFSIRARYGHGGRPGMETEWRASKELCGGGELLDQGVHVIDLIRWFGGEVTEVFGKVETKFWDMEVEDTASAILKTVSDVTASFNVSWTNWKNIFSFEIFGTEGYLSINGLGGSYGNETLEWGRRKKEGGKPDIEVFEFPSEDVSWKNEWDEFRNAILEKRNPIGSGIDGLQANKVVEALYQSSRENVAVKIN